MTAWSYSSISTFKQCPKKYYHLKVARDVKDVGSSAMLYGNELHSAAEEYIRDGNSLPDKFNFIQKSLDSLNKIEGDKHCEIRMGITKDGTKYLPSKFLGRMYGGVG